MVCQGTDYCGLWCQHVSMRAGAIKETQRTWLVSGCLLTSLGFGAGVVCARDPLLPTPTVISAGNKPLRAAIVTGLVNPK